MPGLNWSILYINMYSQDNYQIIRVQNQQVRLSLARFRGFLLAESSYSLSAGPAT
jgi:hypothetical protein